MADAGASTPAGLEAWRTFVAALGDAGEAMAETVADLSPAEQADGFRALVRATHNQLARFEVDRALPELVAFNGWRQKFFMDNPDFRYWVALPEGANAVWVRQFVDTPQGAAVQPVPQLTRPPPPQGVAHHVADHRRGGPLPVGARCRGPRCAQLARHRRPPVEVTPEVDAALAQHRAGNRQHQRGRHRYTPAGFGLDPGELRERFAAYTERFGVAATGSG